MAEPAELLLDPVAMAGRLALVELFRGEPELLGGPAPVAGGEEGTAGQLA